MLISTTMLGSINERYSTSTPDIDVGVEVSHNDRTGIITRVNDNGTVDLQYQDLMFTEVKNVSKYDIRATGRLFRKNTKLNAWLYESGSMM